MAESSTKDRYKNLLVRHLENQTPSVSVTLSSQAAALNPNPVTSLVLPSTGEATDEDPVGILSPQAGQEEADEETPAGEPGTVLEVKHLDEVLNLSTGKWTVKPTPEGEANSTKKKAGKYESFVFNVIRRFTPTNPIGRAGKSQSYNLAKLIEIHSTELRQIGHEAIGPIQGGVSWHAKPLRVTPQMLLGWLPELTAHLSTLEESSTAFTHLSHLLNYLKAEYGSTLESLSALLDHSEITFELLWALFVPKKTILHIHCPLTHEPRAVRLLHADKCQKQDLQGQISFDISGMALGFESSGSTTDNSKFLWRLVVEYLESDVSPSGTHFGYAKMGTTIDIPGFTGTRDISTLGAYPIKYYTGPGGPDGLKQRLVERGKQWAKYAGGVSHLSYKGIAHLWVKSVMGHDAARYSVDSRVIIDRKAFSENMPNYDKLSYASKTLKGVQIDRFAIRSAVGAPSIDNPLGKLEDLVDDDLLLTPPTLYGFSLSDKQWLEFSVDLIDTFEWNEEAYQNLVIPPGQKSVLTTLVEAHSSGPAAKIDDFVKGKGMGLVINLYGNPGTGKSLTAEAMSEYLRKPLYIVGAADLGTNASKIDTSLATILKISAAWGAVVLIDEADVFLEERALHHIERNAMVAVFLRHLEYFQGILFLTTNRVRVFDEAFQSRIHLSLRYHDLNADSRRKIWLAFLHKVHGDDVPDGGLSKEELRQLGEKKINGRQIKNVVKTATALASGRKESLGYRHLEQVLDMMDEFDASQTMYN
ncbi:P-loop containing nucleoside triphosphate hydrolase protein [Irpex rosettiformis]|uniref:P-loop containing nucleoside triphosphate hydrolase protein n=1 Tax=Irpex rosettiformis TaxID=378272 RepID=A0ACB8U5N9_9APHY|nr:P-loop containing nucleoside triphosphate hydrolase protein [Irpex rosettiformis]